MEEYINKYMERFKIIYPNYSEKEIAELIELKIQYWQWLIENYDLFFNNE